ncbi:MAG: RsfS/YbeB/iojap family protein, partial [Elusimicrobiaceae bacterium]|nr:RsfS/YbeB/iojap family protein [Elusimicrobiaceae bacterium]
VYQLHKDGSQSSLWKIIDYGGFIVHIMSKEARKFYMLDDIYSFAKPINWIKKDAKKSRKKSK